MTPHPAFGRRAFKLERLNDVVILSTSRVCPFGSFERYSIPHLLAWDPRQVLRQKCPLVKNKRQPETVAPTAAVYVDRSGFTHCAQCVIHGVIPSPSRSRSCRRGCRWSIPATPCGQ